MVRKYIGRKSCGWFLVFAARKQGFKAGAGFNERFFFYLWQALDVLLNFESPASSADPLFENQLQGAPPPKIFCTAVALMFGKSAFNIRGNAGIQAAVPASDHIYKPIICILHENECEASISFLTGRLKKTSNVYQNNGWYNG